MPEPADRPALRWFEQGKEPDYRFSLANERTFLAWIRTSLAVGAGAALIHQFGTAIQPAGLRAWVTTTIALAGGAIAVSAYVRWRRYEIAMRHDQPLPVGRGFWMVSAGICAGSVTLGGALLLFR